MEQQTTEVMSEREQGRRDAEADCIPFIFISVLVGIICGAMFTLQITMSMH